MTMPVNVAQYISNESARQSAPRFPMILAYEVANNREVDELTERFIFELATCFGFSKYRQTIVSFDHGARLATWSTIPEAMERLVAHAPEESDFSAWSSWIHGFLMIHPFQDGNGRIASLLFNWGMGTLIEPFPLPYYKF